MNLFLINLATPKLPEPMSRICTTSQMETEQGQHKGNRERWQSTWAGIEAHYYLADSEPAVSRTASHEPMSVLLHKHDHSLDKLHQLAT